MLPVIAAFFLLALLGGLAFVAMRMTATAKKDEAVEEEQVPRPAQASCMGGFCAPIRARKRPARAT